MGEQKPRILVVEDEPQVAADICVRLEALGYEPVGPADTAAKALQLASLHPTPELVLMNIVLLGGMDGVEAASELLRQSIPVVYLTAHADDALLERAKITEPLGYLVKPYSDRELQAAVVMALYRHRIERQLAEYRDLLAQMRAELEHKVAERTLYLEETNFRLCEEMRERALIESALRDSKEHLRVLLEVSSDWAWEVDAQGCYTYVSPKVSDLLGYSAEEVIGRTPFDLMPAEEAERVAEIFADAVARRADIHYLENVNRHRDGHLVVLETSGVPIIDAQGVFRGYRGVDRDITARRRTEHALHESGRHLRQIIDMVPHMIFAKDIEGRMLMCNKSCADAYGLSPQDLVGRVQVAVHENAREVEHMLADDRQVITTGRPLLIAEEDFTDVHGNLHILRTLKIPYQPLGSD